MAIFLGLAVRERLHLIKKMLTIGCLGISFLPSVQAQAQDGVVIVGKNDWLLVSYENVLEALDKEAQESFSLIEKLSRMLSRSGVTLALAIIPSKMEIYAEQLPDNFKVNRYMSEFNDHTLAVLRASGVQVIDLKKPMREAALRDLDDPLFFRLDTHWTSSGAFVAAQAIYAGFQVSPVLKKAYEATHLEEYKLTWLTKKQRQNTMRDIVKFLPAGATTYPPEEARRFTVKRESELKTPLLSTINDTEITLIGSGFSGNKTGFDDALRFSLQRRVQNYSNNAVAGHWGSMRTYLQDDSFQSIKPKILLWEIPQRTVGLGPNYRFRLPLHRVDNNEWLLGVAALVQTHCEPALIKAKLEVAGKRLAGDRRAKPTQQAGFAEVLFDKPVDAQSFLSARLKVDGSKQVTLEAYDQHAMVRKFTVETVGDEHDHPFKTPLSLTSKGVTRLKIYPGTANTFAIQDIKICRYQENWLKSSIAQ